MPLSYENLLEKQRAFFLTGKTKNVEFRLEKLKVLQSWILGNSEAILKALSDDLGKSGFEAHASEIMGPLEELKLAIKKVRCWARPKRVRTPLTFFKAGSRYFYEPFGVVLAISAWNYPFTLSLTPLIGALAAGNCCILKPSELAPHTSQLLADMINACFDEEYCAVVQGGADETTLLLNERFDFIHYTGSTRVGKIIALAAAKHLTPVVLEMGGKSPCIVDETADIKISARRICWGKFLNAGQTCIAPDYILVQRKMKQELVAALQEQIKTFYGPDARNSPDYCRIINTNHFTRLAALLKDGNILSGGKTDEERLYIEPTLMDSVSWDSPVMREEIFGPILPILTYDELPELIAKLKTLEKPLALYMFSQNKEAQQKVLNQLSFGGGCINATILHTGNAHLPFGGVGKSGIGNYHGKWSFETFSHKKSILNKSLLFDLPFLYPPYKDKLKWLKKL